MAESKFQRALELAIGVLQDAAFLRDLKKLRAPEPWVGIVQIAGNRRMLGGLEEARRAIVPLLPKIEHASNGTVRFGMQAAATAHEMVLLLGWQTVSALREGAGISRARNQQDEHRPYLDAFAKPFDLPSQAAYQAALDAVCKLPSIFPNKMKLLAKLRREAANAEKSARRSKEKGKPGPGKNINGRMLATIQNDQDAKGWTLKKWASYLKCSEAGVQKTRTWKDLSMFRDKQKAEKAMDRSRNRHSSWRRHR
jgi:hypothetical protein